MSTLTHELYQTPEITALRDAAEKIMLIAAQSTDLDPIAARVFTGIDEIPQEEVDERFALMVQNAAVLSGLDIQAKRGNLEKLKEESEDIDAVVQLVAATGVALASEMPEALTEHAEKFAKAIEITGTSLAEAVSDAQIQATPAAQAIVEAAKDFCDDPDANKNVFRHYKELFKEHVDAQHNDNQKKLDVPVTRLQTYGPGTSDVQSSERYRNKPHDYIDSAYSQNDIETLELWLTEHPETTKKSETHAHSSRKLAKTVLTKLRRSRN